MTTPGQLIARPPASPLANMRATTRVGARKNGSAIWRLECACGQTITADAQAIKRGAATCPECNPTYATVQARRVLALLPCGYATVSEKLQWSESLTKYRIALMRKTGQLHIGGWKRPKAQGAMRPIFHAGPGKDARCMLAAIPAADYERKYRQRVRRAIAKAEAGAQDDGRYSRHIARHMAKKVATAARATPQHPFSALFQIKQEGAAC